VFKASATIAAQNPSRPGFLTAGEDGLHRLPFELGPAAAACDYLQLWPVFPMHADSFSRFLCVCVFDRQISFRFLLFLQGFCLREVAVVSLFACTDIFFSFSLLFCLFVGISIGFSDRRCANTSVDRDREMGRRRISGTLSLVFLCRRGSGIQMMDGCQGLCVLVEVAEIEQD